jgi:hypothetical protein
MLLAAARAPDGTVAAGVCPRSEPAVPSAGAEPLRPSTGRCDGVGCGAGSGGKRFGLSIRAPVREDRNCAAVVETERVGAGNGLRGCAGPLPLLPGGMSREFTASTPRHAYPAIIGRFKRRPSPTPKSSQSFCALTTGIYCRSIRNPAAVMVGMEYGKTLDHGG